MRRKALTKRQSRKQYAKGLKTHSHNISLAPARGGHRL